MKHHRLSPSSSIQNAPLPELFSRLLLEAEDVFDLERLEQVGDLNVAAVGTDMVRASTCAYNTIFREIYYGEYFETIRFGIARMRFSGSIIILKCQSNKL